MKFYKLDKIKYLEFREEIIELYIEAFTTGEYAQYLNKSNVEQDLDELMLGGCGVIVFSDIHIVGVLVATPLIMHSNFSFKNHNDSEIMVDKTIYINEVIVDKKFRGMGIASKMIDEFLNTISPEYFNVVIRVWDKNIPALSLYNKLGFTPIAQITQTKLNIMKEVFEMKKIYLYKKLITNNL